MARFIYDIIAGEIGNKGGHGPMKTPHAVTIHHSAVVRTGKENGKEIAKAYCNWHKNHMPYHFLITRKKSDPIFCTQWVTQFTWHNANYTANKDCIAICVDGNFQSQKPSTVQLRKLKQLLDDLANNWFSKHNWVSFEKNINPKNNTKVINYQGVKVKTLHYHNEVAQPGHSTACCGNKLIPYVKEYRNKKGKVKWGVNPKPTPKPTCSEKLKECEKNYKALDKKYVSKHTELEKLKRVYTKLEKDNKSLQTSLDAKNKQLKDKQVKINKLMPYSEAMGELYSILGLEGDSQTSSAVIRQVKLLKLQKDNLLILIFKAIIKWLKNLRSSK